MLYLLLFQVLEVTVELTLLLLEDGTAFGLISKLIRELFLHQKSKKGVHG